MTTKQLHGPELSPEDVKNFIDDARSRGHTITIIAECEVEYEGRAASDLAAGERVIIIKPDGTMEVHKDEKVKPVNWQPPGCEISVMINDAAPWIEAYRQSPEEIVVVALKTVYSIVSRRLQDDSELELTGTEEDVVEKIVDNPSLIYDDFRVLDTEWGTGAGPVDVYGKNDNGTPICVEAKRGTVSPANVMQLHRYIEAVEDEEGIENVYDGVIVGGSLSDRAENVLEREGFEFREVEPDIEFGNRRTTLDDF